MNIDNDIKYLEYLDCAVRYEKDKLTAIKKAGFPWRPTKVIANVDRFEEETLTTTQSCAKRIISHKALKNLYMRRLYGLVVRECFDKIDFSQLASNPRYKVLRNNIIKNAPELQGVSDEVLLKQIANAIAHGDYDELLKVDALEEKFHVGGEDQDIRSFTEIKTDGQFYLTELTPYTDFSGVDESIVNLVKNVNHKAPTVKSTPLQFYMRMLEGSEDNKLERLRLKVDPSRFVRQNSDERQSGELELEVSFRELDEILLFIMASMNSSSHLALNPRKDSERVNVLPDKNDALADVRCMLSINDVVAYNSKDGSVKDVNLDDNQTEYFYKDYINTRRLFTRDYFAKKYGVRYLADLLSTNNSTPLINLSGVLADSKLDRFSHQNNIISSSVKSHLAYIDKVFANNGSPTLERLVTNEIQKSYGIKQIYETYNESLVSEILLLLQIVEDKGLYRSLRNNETLQSIIDSMDVSALTYFRSVSRHGSDKVSLLKHLRNSITHGNYLITPEGKMFVYDGVSGRDRRLEYKFTIDVGELAAIKDELFALVAGHYPSLSITSDAKEKLRTNMEEDNYDEAVR